MTSPDFQIPRTVTDMMQPDAPTAPLEDFLVAYAMDDNWWWRLSSGHRQNLFEDALDQIDATGRGLMTPGQLVDEFNDAAEGIELEAEQADRGPAFKAGMRYASEYLRTLASQVEARNGAQ